MQLRTVVPGVNGLLYSAIALTCVAVLTLFPGAPARADAISAGGPLLAGLKYERKTLDDANWDVELHIWKGPGAHFALRSARTRFDDMEWNGYPELHLPELTTLAKALANTTVESSQPDTGRNGPYGNFRVRLFRGTLDRHCMALRSYDGLNRSNMPLYDDWDGDAEPMGEHWVAGVYCRVGQPLTDTDIEHLIASIK